MEDVELVLEPRDDLLDIAAFLVALRVIGCGLYKALSSARETGFTPTAYIIRKYYVRLYTTQLLTAMGGSICIGPKGIRIVDLCEGDVECVKQHLENTLTKL